MVWEADGKSPYGPSSQLLPPSCHCTAPLLESNFIPPAPTQRGEYIHGEVDQHRPPGAAEESGFPAIRQQACLVEKLGIAAGFMFMSTHGRTVRIYLSDGSPTGIRHAEVVNWTGQAIVCPRARIGELSNWTESQRPGLYILIGEDPETSHPMAYVGEAENVLTRLKQHAKEKDFWAQVVFFTSKDENLTKAHVKYLESRVVELVNTAKRITLANGTAPTPSPLPRPDRDAMEEFLEPARILLGSLGFHFLEALQSQKESGASTVGNGPLSHVTLYFTVPKHGVNAQGIWTDEGFIVSEGSIGSKEIKGILSPGWIKRRMELIQDGAFVESGDHLRLTKDVLFSSPSAATDIISGLGRNGRISWKDKDGKTLAQLEEALLSAPATSEGNEESCPN